MEEPPAGREWTSPPAGSFCWSLIPPRMTIVVTALPEEKTPFLALAREIG
jgi:hypothetical protein